ncbi:serpin family protein [Nannocystis sp. SCPEA4]|uniref:serpin family protein n=1 Tax=Nannocystis sp. SCPEA4 TaxID=2996787 RepID=UPI00226EF7FD|nr:serpin family protein [Nannocystis sp. SCPEA4]MCY1054852.1 serpin family protein [Nannocystis sp. SCPEA4]MCY1059742.1 serpin family protein [Nannocystis sp. SCPEA4]
MSQRVPRILVVCLALAGCDTAAKPEPAPDTAVSAPAPTPPPPAEKTAPAPAPVKAVEPAEPPPPPPRVATELKPVVVRSINELTIDLQRKLAKQPGNLLVSGMSVAVALAQVHAGSGGATAKELAKVLNIDAPADGLHAAFAGMLARWTHPDGNITLDAASRLFGEQKFAFKPEFIDKTRTVFAAALEPLDLAAGDLTAARDRINGWMRDRTGDHIDEVVPADALAATTRLLAADAAYFKADWQEPFDASATTEQMFHGVEHRRPVPMMHAVQRLRLAFGLAGKIRVLEIPYKGGEYSMVILLPSKRDGLKTMEKSISAAKLQSWLDAAKPISIDLKLPRFTLDSHVDLGPALFKLGAARVFDPKKADLSGMASEKKLALSAVHHRARLAVEERGSEATGVPAIEIAVGNAPAQSIPFIVDHPFLFYIRDTRSGALLFYGRVTDPE